MWATLAKFKKQRTGSMTSSLRILTLRASLVLVSLRILIQVLLATVNTLTFYITGRAAAVLLEWAKTANQNRVYFKSELLPKKLQMQPPRKSINVSMTYSQRLPAMCLETITFPLIANRPLTDLSMTLQTSDTTI